MNNDTYFEHGYALLIGIRYGYDRGPLNGTLRDVEDIQNHFLNTDKAAYKKENVIALTEENATAAGILQALDELAVKANKDEDATVIVHYSGHGARVGQDYFFVPYDCDLDRLRQHKTFDKDKVVLSKQFVEKIDNIRVDKKLIVLDCCHAEDIVKRSLDDSPMLHFLDGFADELNKELEAHSTRNVSTTQLKKGSGSVILTSCEAHETSLDLGTNGLFTQVMLECLNGKNNIRKDGWVRLIDMMNYIPMEVSRRADPHPQNPVFKRIENLRTGDFIICAYNNSTNNRDLESDNQQQVTMSTENIRALISRGKLEDAFKKTQEVLKTIGDSDLTTQVGVLSDKHNENEKKNRIGVIDNREHGTTRSQVVYGLLGILTEIDKVSAQTPSSSSGGEETRGGGSTNADELKTFKTQLHQILDTKGFEGVPEVLSQIESSSYDYNKATLADLRSRAIAPLTGLAPASFIVGLKVFIDSIR